MHDTIMNLFYSLVDFGTNHTGMFLIITLLIIAIIVTFGAWCILGFIDMLFGKRK